MDCDKDVDMDLKNAIHRFVKLLTMVNTGNELTFCKLTNKVEVC